MSALSVRKGKVAERAVVNLLKPVIGRVCAKLDIAPTALTRNLKQVQQGGYDLEGIDWLAIEIKHHKVPALNSWWEQACRQAREGQEPILIWKKHGGTWRVRQFVGISIAPGRWQRVVGDVSFEAFLVWLEKRLEVELGALGTGEGR